MVCDPGAAVLADLAWKGARDTRLDLNVGSLAFLHACDPVVRRMEDATKADVHAWSAWSKSIVQLERWTHGVWSPF